MRTRAPAGTLDSSSVWLVGCMQRLGLLLAEQRQPLLQLGSLLCIERLLGLMREESPARAGWFTGEDLVARLAACAVALGPNQAAAAQALSRVGAADPGLIANTAAQLLHQLFQRGALEPRAPDLEVLGTEAAATEQCRPVLSHERHRGAVDHERSRVRALLAALPHGADAAVFADVAARQQQPLSCAGLSAWTYSS